MREHVIVSASADFAEHVRELEEFLAYEDPPTKLLEALREKIEKVGLDALSPAERIYYALNDLMHSVHNLGLVWFYRYRSPQLRVAAAEGIRLLGTPGMLESANKAVELAGVWYQGDTQEISEEQFEIDDCLCTPFLSDEFNFFDVLDEYAEDQGLF